MHSTHHPSLLLFSFSLPHSLSSPTPSSSSHHIPSPPPPQEEEGGMSFKSPPPPPISHPFPHSIPDNPGCRRSLGGGDYMILYLYSILFNDVEWGRAIYTHLLFYFYYILLHWNGAEKRLYPITRNADALTIFRSAPYRS